VNRRWATGQQGIALMSVLTTIFILALLGSTVMYLSGKEIALSTFRLSGAQSLAITEGGATSARAALMALMNAEPIRFPPDPNERPLHDSLTYSVLDTLYAGGNAASQNPFGLFDYLMIDGQRITIGATSTTTAVYFDVNWALATSRLKLQVGTQTSTPPSNLLGGGSYASKITLTRRLSTHPYDPSAPERYIHALGGGVYEFYYTYSIASDGQLSPQYRRRVTLEHDFSVRVALQTFARYSLFTHVHTTPSGGNIWFTSRTSFDGPVHTNGEFRFAFFPKFGTPDSQTPCNESHVAATSLTSVSRYANFNNNGNPRRLQANENVVGGQRRDAPVLPDCTPANDSDDNNNAAANFTRGVSAIAMPTNAYSQKGVSIGRDPADLTSVSNLAIRQAIPELADNTSAIPTGIYLPVVDTNGNGGSDSGEAMAGGIFVQGDLTSLTQSVGGASSELAIYTLVQGSQTVTVTVDRANNTTTVTNTAWASPQTRTFAGVPKGWQNYQNNNALIIYVEGNINALSGTLEEKEQATITASGNIDITNHLRYEVPPVVTDPTSNPLNTLGLYTPTGDVRITTSAPNDLVLHAIVMAGNGNTSDNHSSVRVVNHDVGSPRGTVQLIGGLIEEYYGAFGTFNSSTGAPEHGYGRDFRFDRRVQRGIAPPYFPTNNQFELAALGLANTRPIWREAAP
jgi:hypothetical protein